MPHPRVIIVEDHPLLSSALRALLEGKGFRVVAETGRVAEARKLDVQGVALAIVDVQLADGSGLDLVRGWSERGVACVVLTGHVTPSVVREARAVGARGLVSKGSPIESVLEALAAVSRGDSYECDAVREVMGVASSGIELTTRETQVLTAIAAGRSNKQIAAVLGVAVRTVETHRERLMQKLGAHNAADLTRAAMERALLPRS